MKRRRGLRVTFLIRGAMFDLVSQLASGMGSSLASLCQVLIVTGSVFEYVKFEDAEHLGEFLSAARGNKLADDVDEQNPFKGVLTSLSRTSSLLAIGPSRNRPHIEGSELMKVRLPSSFVRRIDLYAKITNASRSAILTRFFVRGLMLYMRSQRDLMRAILEAMTSKSPDPQV